MNVRQDAPDFKRIRSQGPERGRPRPQQHPIVGSGPIFPHACRPARRW